MNFCVYDDCTWLYPDSPLAGPQTARLDAPRGGHAAFQLLVDKGGECRLTFHWKTPDGPPVSLYRLVPVGVNENTAPTLMTTTDYAACRDYVTRAAPFEVYDAMAPCAFGEAVPGRAFYLCAEPAHRQVPGLYSGELTIEREGERAVCPVECRVYAARVPAAGEGVFSMLNFFCYENIATQHGAAEGSREWRRLMRRYIRAQLDMRCTHILLPSGRPLTEDGRLVGFDFSLAEEVGRIALEEGAPKLCGGHVAHWHEWTDPEYYPFWDQELPLSGEEGYFQLRMYFSQWARVINKNGWHKRMTQALADEPQVHNAVGYRMLAAVCRKFLPGVPILDAVETTNLGGGVDVWVPKLDTWEKHEQAFRRLQAAGEEMWFYTCAFPAGRAVNRSMDLPLTVSRGLLWLAAREKFSGYLHWGFNYYIGPDIWRSACCPHKGALLPAGDAHIVYPGPDGPWRSLRFEAQRGGAEDCELLRILQQTDPGAVKALTKEVCASSTAYTADGGALLAARRRLLEKLEGETAAC